MGYKVTTAVWDNSKAKGSDLLVLVAIADNADNETGLAFPSIKYLAEKSRLTERSVQYSIGRLKDIGELEVVENQGRVNTFRVTLFTPELSNKEQKKLIARAEELVEKRGIGGAKISPLGGAKFAPGGVQSTTKRGAIHDNGIERARDTIEPELQSVSLSLTSGERENCVKEIKRLFPNVLSIPKDIPMEKAYLFLHKVRTGEIRREQIYSPVAYMAKMLDEDISGPLGKEREKRAARRA